jgi:hypothetical protein
VILFQVFVCLLAFVALSSATFGKFGGGGGGGGGGWSSGGGGGSKGEKSSTQFERFLIMRLARESQKIKDANLIFFFLIF